MTELATPARSGSRPSPLARAASGAAAGLVAGAFTLAFVAFGGRSLGWVVIATAAASATAALLLAVAAAIDGRAAVPPRALVVATIALVALPLVGIVPLPMRVVRALSPVRAAIEDAVPASLERWPTLVDGGGTSVSAALAPGAALEAQPKTNDASARRTDGRRPLSFDPAATRVAVLVLAGALLMLLALATLPCERLGLRLLAWVVPVTTVGAIYAVAWARVGNGRIYGVFAPPPAIGQRPFGPFWNPNHFAALLAFACCLTLGALLARSASRGRRLVALVLLAPLAAALVDAGSRGGVVALGAGVGTLAVALIRRPGRRVAGTVLAAGTAVAVGLALTALAPWVVGRTFEQASSLVGSNAVRARIYAVDVRMPASAPWVGVGLGAFRPAFAAHATEANPIVPLHGESDWLEVLAEGGIPLGIAWTVLLASLLAKPATLAWRGRLPVLACGLLAGVVAVIVHAAVDFHLHEPAVALPVLIAAATVHAWAARLDRERREFPGVGHDGRASPAARSGRAFHWVFAGVACAVLAGIAWTGMSEVPYDIASRAAEARLAVGDAEGATAAAKHAVRSAPAHGEGWALLAAAHALSADRVGFAGLRRTQWRRSLEAAVEAIRRAPATLGAARRAGDVLLAAGAPDAAWDAARLALAVSPGQTPTQRLAGRALLRAGRPDDALAHLALALEAAPIEHLAAEAAIVAPLLREAGHRDPRVILAALTTDLARVRYLHGLSARKLQAEIPPYLDLLGRGEIDTARANELSYALVLGSSAEAAALAGRLLPHVAGDTPRYRVGAALVDGGDVAAGRSVLERLIAEGAAPAGAFLRVGDAQRAASELPAARATYEAGLRAHPADAGLSKRLKTLTP